ncbi:MAG: TIGR02186 family protein [Bauldia sp.]
MTRAVLLATVVLAGLTGEAGAERLTIALSTPEVKINSNFTGTSLTIFGVVERDAATVGRTTAGYQVAVVVRGPGESVVARRKDRVLGVWANNASQTFLSAPSFYAVDTSTGLSDLAPAEQLRRLQIGFENISLIDARSTASSDADQTTFREAFLRLKEQSGLYAMSTGVDFIGDTIFRATVWIPANVPVGHYAAVVTLFSDGTPLATAEDRIFISKTGFERFMFAASRQSALVYGLATVILALFTGWLAGVIFRRD